MRPGADYYDDDTGALNDDDELCDDCQWLFMRVTDDGQEYI